MKNAVIDLYEDSSYYIVDEIKKIGLYNIIGVIPTSYSADSGKFGLNNDISINSSLEQFVDNFDLCIILNNENVRREVVYDRINRFLLFGKSVDCYYPLNKDEIALLKKIAAVKKVSFNYYGIDFAIKKDSQKSTEIPIIYISGMHKECDILSTHIVLNSVLKKQGYNVANVTNSEYAELFNFIPISSLYNNKGFNGFSSINNAKVKINNIINHIDADVLVISNIYNFAFFDDYVEEYGWNHYVLNNIFDIDYIIYNLPLNTLGGNSEGTLHSLVDSVSIKTNNAEVILGASHVDLENYNSSFVRIRDEEYLLYYEKYCKKYIDPLSEKHLVNALQLK